MCVAVPRLALDRPFTYLADDGMDLGTGSLVSVPFHGRTVRGWVLGQAQVAPSVRLLPIRAVRGPVRFFDPAMLELLRWVSERYIAPLCTVIERSYPPRVVGEERSVSDHGPVAAEPVGVEGPAERPASAAREWPHPDARRVLDTYGGHQVVASGPPTWLRPLPREEAEVCVAAVEAVVARRRTAVVLVPEAAPLPFTARAVLQRFRDGAVAFLGGDPRERYRMWLAIRAGGYEVVVGTRPAVFAPLRGLGLIWVSREVHPGHREDRSPYYHVREVAMARARIAGAACVLASLSPSVDTAVAIAEHSCREARPRRASERTAAPLVETVPPEAEDRSVRLGSLLRTARSGALIASRRGYGVARVCRSCKGAASCSVCHGPIVMVRGSAVCRVCGAPGRCPTCGGASFGIERGGSERVAEWARRISPAEVMLGPADGESVSSEPGRIVVGNADLVKDTGPLALDVVGILDPDRALSRAGIHAGEQALATWMEAAAWAGPRDGGGRVLVQTRHPGHPAVQALVRWDPVAYLLGEGRARAGAGFPPRHPVFRVAGTDRADAALRQAGADHLLVTAGPSGTLCLATVHPGALPGFRRKVLELAAAGIVTRVEAEPQL